MYNRPLASETRSVGFSLGDVVRSTLALPFPENEVLSWPPPVSANRKMVASTAETNACSPTSTPFPCWITAYGSSSPEAKSNTALPSPANEVSSAPWVVRRTAVARSLPAPTLDRPTIVSRSRSSIVASPSQMLSPPTSLYIPSPENDLSSPPPGRKTSTKSLLLSDPFPQSPTTAIEPSERMNTLVSYAVSPQSVAFASPASPNDPSGLPFGRYRARKTCSPAEPAFPAARILPSGCAATAFVSRVFPSANCAVPPPKAMSTPPAGLTNVTAMFDG